jgi:predicted amidohydrolase
MHIPQDPGFEEKFYFTPGDLGYRVWDTNSAASACSSAGTNGIPRPPA